MAAISAKVEMMEVGMATAAISVVRMLARNRKMIDGCEDAAFHQVVLDGIDGRLDEYRLIADDLALDVFRQCRRNLLQAPLHLARRRHGVLAGLLGHHQGDRRDTVQTGRAAGFFVAVLGVTDVAHLYGVAIAIGHRYFVELRRVHHSAGGAHSKLLRAGIQVPARQFQVLRAQCVEHIGDGKVVGAQTLRDPPARGSRAARRRRW